MTTPVFGVTPQGFNAMRLEDVKNQLEDLFIAEFGDINLDSQSVTGQIIGIFAKVLADDWENLQDVYASQYPNSASGISLDNVVALNGLTRLPESQTSVIGSATGLPGTLIPAGSLARLTGSGEIFYSTANAFISNGNALANTVNVQAAAAQEYKVLISNVPYVYSLPIISLSGPMTAGDVISVRINGVNIPTSTYAVSNNDTLTDQISKIIAGSDGAVASGTVVGNTIKLVPALGREIIVNSVNVAGGSSPTATVIFDTPASTAIIAQYLSANINSASNVSSNWVSGSSFTIQVEESTAPYSIIVGTNLQITSTSSPVLFLAQTFGPIPAPANTLTVITTPIAGWTSLTNLDSGITGSFEETDAELRLRRANSLRILGAATVEAIRARLLQEVPGVTSVTIFENVTMTQNPITGLFSGDFIAGTSVEAKIDGLVVGTATFASSNLQVMNDLAILLVSDSRITSATVGGTGDHLITLTMFSGQEIELELTPAGASAPSVNIAGGIPPKSFETVVEGGSDAAVALKIWQLKPAGIATFGTVHEVIIDSQGNPQGINFTRATPVYIWVTVALTLNPQETFPVNGQELVSEAILAYGNSLGIGIDVFIQRVQAAVFTVSGIASATVLLARTANPTDLPSYAALDIDITETEISAWSLGRITVSI